MTSANVACGYHAGDAGDHARGLRRGGPARGRRSARRCPTPTARTSAGSRLDVPPDVLRDQVADQVGTLRAIAGAAGTRVRYLKPHGALYHRVVDDEEQARGGAGRVRRPAGARAARVGCCSRWRRRPAGRCCDEGFPDRGYTAGRAGWCPATEPGALVDRRRRGRARAVALALGAAASTRSACTATRPGAVAHARAVRRALEAAGYVLRPFA